MTACFRTAKIDDHWPKCLRPFWGLEWGSRLPRFGWRIVLVACLMAGEVTLAAEPFDSEDISMPVPSHSGSFESLDGGYESVLVDDVNVGDSNGISAQSQDAGSDQSYGRAAEEFFSCSVDPAMNDNAATVPEAMSWDSILVSRAAGGCGAGMFNARPVEHVCLDGYDNSCSPDGDCHGGCLPGSRWAIQAEALVLWRNSIDGQPILADTAGAVALDTGDVRTAAAGGPRIGILHNLGCGRAIEGNYFNVGGIQGSTSTDGLGAPYTPIGLADIAFTDIQSAEYTTRGQIKSAELNYRWCQGKRIIWLTGFRWVEWNEIAKVDMQEASGEDRQNDIQANAGNDLYGGQFGCRLKFWDLGKWQVGAVGKAGVFGNTAYQRTTATVDGEILGPLGANDTNVAFFGEVGVNSTLWLNRWLAWRAGYNFFWLQGVATAASQFSLANFGSETASIESNESVFLQGFSTGLEARW